MKSEGKKDIDLNKDEFEELGNSVRDVLEGVGEERAQVSVNVRKTPKGTPDYIMLFQKVAMEISYFLTPAACKVFLYLLSESGYENLVPVDVKTIMENTGIKSRITANRALDKLQEHNIVLKVQNKTDLRRKDYFINPISAWRGKMHNYKKAVQWLNKHQSGQLKLKLGSNG